MGVEHRDNRKISLDFLAGGCAGVNLGETVKPACRVGDKFGEFFLVGGLRLGRARSTADARDCFSKSWSRTCCSSRPETSGLNWSWYTSLDGHVSVAGLIVNLP